MAYFELRKETPTMEKQRVQRSQQKLSICIYSSLLIREEGTEVAWGRGGWREKRHEGEDGRGGTVGEEGGRRGHGGRREGEGTGGVWRGRGHWGDGGGRGQAGGWRGRRQWGDGGGVDGGRMKG
jgi:hypothetical protein